MNLGRSVIAAGCLYELAALPERSPLPTITEIVKRGNNSKLKWLTWVWAGVWSAHFLSD